MAEWLCSGLQSRVRRFDSGFSLQIMSELDINKRLVIITTSFAPENAIGAVRLSSMARHLSKKFISVHVICPSSPHSLLSDTTLEINNIQNLEVIRTKSSIIFRFVKYLRNKVLSEKKASEVINLSNKEIANSAKIKSYIMRLAFKAFTFLRNRDFLYGALKAYKELNKANKFDILITSYPSFSSHQAGLRIKRMDNNIKWVADFRDPMVYKSFSSSRKLSSIQAEVMKNSNHVITVSNGVKEMLQESSVNNKIDVIYNGYDNVPNIEILPSINKKELNLCYVGTLYDGKRDLSPLFKILNVFLVDGRIENFKFHYAGSDIRTLIDQASKYGLSANIINHGYVSRLQSMKIQKSCDFVVVGTWNSIEEKGILTGKIFEAFMLRKPIIGIVNGDLQNSEFKNLIEDCNAGVAIESNFLSEIDKNNIIDLLNKVMQAKDDSSKNNPINKFTFEVEQFHYKEIFNNLSNILISL
tara:strand:+ start:1964 stop:3376 length:1413 start_codon:yes stop_codon:yes gene_type:complete